MKITVEINGESFNCTNEMPLSFLLEYLDFNTSMIIVEYNSTILHKEAIDSVRLNNKDKLEIITIVGGG
nr:ThiS [Pseudoerythrocladia kornmannii]